MTPDPTLKRWQVLACLALLVLVAAALRARGLSSSIYGDEAFHFAVADRHAAGQGLTVAPDVPYRRALPFTEAVIACRSAFGDSEWAQRLPAFLASLGCVVLLFVVGNRWFGPAVGLLGAAILALDVQSVFFGSYARFYSTAEFFSLLSVLAFERGYAALEPARPRWFRAGAWGALSAAALLAALSVQVLALGVGLGALSFLAGRAVLRRRGGGGRDWRRWPETWILAAVLPVLALGALLVRPSGLLGAMTHLPLWNAKEGLVPLYYVAQLRTLYPFECVLASVGFLFALSWRPRGALLAFSFFVPAFVVHSLLPQKVPRYVFLLLPYFFLFAACGYLFLFRQIRDLGGAVHGRLRTAAAVCLVGALMVLSPSASGRRAARGANWVDWRAAVAKVAGEIRPSDAIVAGVGDDVFAVAQYTGRADAHVCTPEWEAHRWKEMPGAKDQAGGPYGIPCLSTLPAFQEIASRHGRAWVFLRSDHVRRSDSKIAPAEVLTEMVEWGTRKSRAGDEVTIVLLEREP